MKKDIRINPIGLKGNQINERMKELMGIGSADKNNSTSVVELTKVGPDGNAYAIVRENHEYYIKTTPKKKDIIAEDFQYIGGLKNKKSEAYPSYAKAIKHLNLKFNSLAESFDRGHNINVFENDNILESGVAGFSQYQGNGFSGEGNLAGNIPMFEEEQIDGEDEVIEETKEEEEDVELTEVEAAIDDMGKEDEVPVNTADPKEQPGYIHEVNKLSIARALENMDAIIDSLSEGTEKKKVYTIK